MPYPTPKLILLLALPAALTFGALWLPVLPVILALDGVCLAVMLIDGLSARRAARSIQATLHAPRTWSLNRQQAVMVDLQPNLAAGRYCRLMPDLSPELELKEGAAELSALPDHRLELTWTLTPRLRGAHSITGLHLGMRSRGGLWIFHRVIPTETTLQVYPDLKQLAEYELLARTNRLNLIGIRRSRRLGGETEFDSLRDYRVGDPLRVIDWKATARRHALTSRDFTVSQAQNLMLMIDAGRMMGARCESGSSATLLDGAIDAALMLAHVARKQGDLAGILVYNRGILRFLPPASNPHQINRIIHALHDVQVAPVESRHDLAFLHLSRHFHKRTLLIHLTHVLDSVNTETIVRQLTLLSGRHLPLAVLLRDPDCQAPLNRDLEDVDDMYRAAAAAAVLNHRAAALERLRNAGILTLDCEVRDLTAGIISRYLHIKAQNLL